MSPLESQSESAPLKQFQNGERISFHDVADLYGATSSSAELPEQKQLVSDKARFFESLQLTLDKRPLSGEFQNPYYGVSEEHMFAEGLDGASGPATFFLTHQVNSGGDEYFFEVFGDTYNPEDAEEAARDYFEKPDSESGETIEQARRGFWRRQHREESVSSLSFTRHGNMWDLHDRITQPEYRGQGIAGGLLDAAEQFIQNEARDTQETQAITINAAQVDVLVWLLNRGYKPASEEDADRLERLLSGDGSLVVKTIRDSDGGWVADYYVYTQEEIEHGGEPLKRRVVDEDGDEYFNEEYMERAFRIHLKKEFTPLP